MEGFQGKRRLSISEFLFKKSPRNFRGSEVGLGLGIVAAMNDGSNGGPSFSVSPRSRPIPIVSSMKAAANFRSGLNLDAGEEDKVDESSESYTCVISRRDGDSVTKRVYFDGKLSEEEERPVAVSKVFSASPEFIEKSEEEFWASDFLSYCLLCKKQLDGLDIFMYRGEKAFCSWDCRDKHIRGEDYKEKCSSEAIKSLDFSASPCSSPQLFLAGVVAA